MGVVQAQVLGPPNGLELLLMIRVYGKVALGGPVTEPVEAGSAHRHVFRLVVAVSRSGFRAVVGLAV